MISLLCYSLGLTLAIAGMAHLVGRSIDAKRFSIADFLTLTALAAVALAIYLAGRNWSPP